MSAPVQFSVNGQGVSVAAPAVKRLADVLRDDLGLTGTKIGCNAGDCGACTVLMDGQQVCACMVSLAQAEGSAVATIEGLANGDSLHKLQAAFHRHGAAQCGICTPGMLMAASDLLARVPQPSAAQVKDALAGVLCRCTGYLKIVEAVLDIAGVGTGEAPPAGAAVGARLAKLDGLAKLNGAEAFGADAIPGDAFCQHMESVDDLVDPHEQRRVAIAHLDVGQIITGAKQDPRIGRSGPLPDDRQYI